MVGKNPDRTFSIFELSTDGKLFSLQRKIPSMGSAINGAKIIASNRNLPFILPGVSG